VELLAADRRYGLAVLAVCLATTAMATAVDSDEGAWLLAATFTATLATVLIPGGLPSVQQVRRSPHVVWFWSLLLVVAAGAGATDVTPELMVGAAGCAAAGYLAALAVSRYAHAKAVHDVDQPR
jgi:hypothetical protein